MVTVLTQLSENHALEIFDSFFRVGSLVFGGGHVVLALLSPKSWVQAGSRTGNLTLCAGRPKPYQDPVTFYTTATFIGDTVERILRSGAPTVVAIFLPSFIFVDRPCFRFWDLRRSRWPAGSSWSPLWARKV